MQGALSPPPLLYIFPLKFLLHLVFVSVLHCLVKLGIKTKIKVEVSVLCVKEKFLKGECS